MRVSTDVGDRSKCRSEPGHDSAVRSEANTAIPGSSGEKTTASRRVGKQEPPAASPETVAGFGTLFETMAEAFAVHEVIHDATGKPHDLRYIEVNPAFERLTGRTRGQVLGRTARELFPEADPGWYERIGGVARTGEPALFEAHSETTDRWFEIRAHGTAPALVAVIFMDITDRKRAEKEQRWRARRDEILSDTAARLLQSDDPQRLVENLCRQVMDFLDCHVFFNYLVDPEQQVLLLNACAGIPDDDAGRIRRLNYGMAVCGCVARDRQRIIAEDIRNTADPRTNLVKTYGVQAYCCHPLIVQDRLIGTLSFGSRSLTHFSPESVAVMKAVTDQVAFTMYRIDTERTLREDEERLRSAAGDLRRLNETLEQRVIDRTAEVEQQAKQLRALASELSNAEQRERKRLATILHNHIQQLLVGVRMQLESVTREPRPDRIRLAAQEMDAILQEAIDAARSLTVDLSPPVLHETGLVGGFGWLAARMLEKNQFKVQLRLDARAEPASEELRLLLFECVRELLFNAYKHAGVSEAELLLLPDKDDRVRIIVHDAGRGFDPARLQRRKSDDSTFGLFSVQQRLAHVGGTVEIETAPGRGTKITLTAPLGRPAPAADVAPVPGPPERAEALRLRGKVERCRVLIVDDHKIMRDGLRGLFQFESDMEVVGEAADGPEAIALAASLDPDVIVMDINLGEMNGIEATRRIMARNPGARIIGLSMHTDSNVADAMRAAGAVSYVTKGGRSEDLIEAIRASCRT